MERSALTPMGRRIRAGMIARGIQSAAALAARTNLPRATVRRWMTQPIRDVDASTLFRIADEVRLSARWVLTGEGSPTTRPAVTPTQRRIVEIYEELPRQHRSILLQCALCLAAERP